LEPAVPLLPQAVRTQKTLLKPFLSGIHAGVICPWRLGVSEVGHTVIVNVENVAQAGVHPARLDLGSEADVMRCQRKGCMEQGILDHSTTSSVTYLSDAKDGVS
jgi:hypothetical protein